MSEINMWFFMHLSIIIFQKSPFFNCTVNFVRTLLEFISDPKNIKDCLQVRFQDTMISKMNYFDIDRTEQILFSTYNEINVRICFLNDNWFSYSSMAVTSIIIVKDDVKGHQNPQAWLTMVLNQLYQIYLKIRHMLPIFRNIFLLRILD
jgi:hypothetical protein